MYLAIIVEIDRKNIFTGEESAEPKYYAYAEKVRNGANVLSQLDIIGCLKVAEIYQTRKEAIEVVARWRNSFKRNGTYAFCEPSF